MSIIKTNAPAPSLRRRQALGLAGATLLPRLTRAQGRQKITVWTWGGVERFTGRVEAFKRLFPS